MLLTSSGEGGVLIDSDVVFHTSGFPFIPAKRVKGMLRESMEEVMEIKGEDESTIELLVNSLFGESGKQTYEGKLLFSNLFIQGWDQICKGLAKFPQPAFQPDFIKTYFTTEIQQTAIGKNGIAKDKSLRNYRVINPGYSFEASVITTEELTSQEWNYLEKAAQNLRYAGTRRNRGFGKVSCEVEEDKAPASSGVNAHISDASGSGQLSVEITTVSPVVLAQQLGEQNTVFTSRYISGSQVRGLLANAYIKSQQLTRSNAHLNSNFYELFLSGKVKFGNLNFRNSSQMPMHIQQFKANKKEKPISVFENDSEITRPIAKLGKIVENMEANPEDIYTVFTEGLTPQTTLFFHNSRKNRRAGRSTENEGSIFYYESLNENQSFSGQISGSPHLITHLKSVLPSRFSERLGRSRSVQYGEIEISLSAIPAPANTTYKYPAGKYLLVLKSPLILFNKFGLPEPGKESLCMALSEIITQKPIILNAFATTTVAEQFNASWLSKSGKCLAYKEGSSFLIELPNELVLPKPLEFLGEWNEQGFGRLTFEIFESNSTYQWEPESSNSDRNSENQPEAQAKTTGVPILDKIVENFNYQQSIIKVKTKAIQDASSSGNTRLLKNHLIGRMERLFESSQTPEEIQEWVGNCFKNNAASKPAGETLQKAGLINDKNEFSLNKSGEKIFEFQKHYWITFFQTLRKKNKSNGNLQAQ